MVLDLAAKNEEQAAMIKTLAAHIDAIMPAEDFNERDKDATNELKYGLPFDPNTRRAQIETKLPPNMVTLLPLSKVALSSHDHLLPFFYFSGH